MLEQFWSKVDIKGSNDCWNWLAGKVDGYGSFWCGYTIMKHFRSHRISWELCNKKEIPEGMLILHHCDNRSCCNPAHLYCGTRADNVYDTEKRNDYDRRICGAVPALSIEDVKHIKILAANGKTRRAIGKLFGVAHSLINSAINNPNHPTIEGYKKAVKDHYYKGVI